jgi:hypothetical protein
MKTTVNTHDFVDAFDAYNRGDNFSDDGLIALFDYLTELEEACGIDIELDVIALCCEYTEYESLEAFHDCYDAEDYPDLDILRDYTTVIEIDTDSFIIQDF